MPKRSLEDLPAGPIRDLGLPGRAVAALTRAGIVRTEELAVLTRRELAAIDGVGPGMITAIRRVVPEPPTGIRPAASPQAAALGRAAAVADPGGDPAGDQGPDATEEVGVTEDDATEDDAPAAPVMPSFASLRAPQRRTALDLLMPDAEPEAPEPETPEPETPEPPATRPAPAAGLRPPDYADLLALGVHVVRAAIAVPVRLALWSVRAPVHSLRRLLGR